jgi:chemotaxis protein MotB
LSKRTLLISKETGNDGPGWLTTFNDLITLLMVFFVLLFAMGSVDTQMLQEFQYGLQSGLGILGAGSKVSIAVRDTQQNPNGAQLLIQAAVETEPEDQKVPTDTIDEALKVLTEEPGINVRYSNQSAQITFEDFLLFDFGKADINPSGLAFLNKMATLIQKIPYPVRVEGHTDNVPIHTARFPSNWELSIARAVSVVKYFAAEGKISPQRLSAVGYGETRPLVPNNSPANSSKNRRVEIVLATEGER